MDSLNSWILVGVIALVTAAIRFLPFLIFGGKRKVPGVIKRLGGMLPFAVMGMLVVYCLRGLDFSSAAGFLPALISCALVVVLHARWRKTLLSIISGTVCYMLLVQLVF